MIFLHALKGPSKKHVQVHQSYLYDVVPIVSYLYSVNMSPICFYLTLSADGAKIRHNEPFQPIATERKQIPSAVTADDLADAANKLHDVMFQMETLVIKNQA